MTGVDGTSGDAVPSQPALGLAGRRLLDRAERPVFGFLVAIAATLVALVLRRAMDDMLPHSFPYLTFFPAVILTASLCGLWSGLVCAILSAAVAWYVFILPSEALALDRTLAWAPAIFTLTSTLVVGLIVGLRRLTARLDAEQATTRAMGEAQDRLRVELQRETELRIAHEALAEKTALLDLALQAASAGTWRYIIGSNHAQLSPEIARQHGLGDAAIEIDVAADWQPMVHPEDAERTLASLSQAIATRGKYESDYRIILADGTTRWVAAIGRVDVDPAGEATGVIGLTFDITARKLAEQRAEHLARHDPLTGLANRMQFHERLDHDLARALRRGESFALLSLDLDGFKAVNDAYGHAVGDALLQTVAGRIRDAIRTEDLAARLGGDEFVVIQVGAARSEDAEALAARLIQAVSTPIVVETQVLAIGVSVGIAMVPETGTEAEAIYRSADQALYRAKRSGRNTFRVAEALVAARSAA